MGRRQCRRDCRRDRGVFDRFTGAGRRSDRVLATVLFTDIVGSTEKAAALGDRGWRDLLDNHHATIRRNLARFRGHEIKTTGDGILATFDGPARGVRCACAIAEEIKPLGIEIRAGLHTGECEMIGDDVGGIAVHIGARVAALAGCRRGVGVEYSEGPSRRLWVALRRPRQPIPQRCPRRMAYLRGRTVKNSTLGNRPCPPISASRSLVGQPLHIHGVRVTSASPPIADISLRRIKCRGGP